MKYRCKETLYVDGFNDDGFEIGYEIDISVGEEFQRQDGPFRVLGESDSVRLTNENTWLEISQDTLDEHFELIDEERPGTDGQAD